MASRFSDLQKWCFMKGDSIHENHNYSVVDKIPFPFQANINSKPYTFAKNIKEFGVVLLHKEFLYTFNCKFAGPDKVPDIPKVQGKGT